MRDFRDFDQQFAETPYERMQRQVTERRRRTAEGKCWQCNRMIAYCSCPNLNHAPAVSSQPLKKDERR